jgi:hypothetical protein
MEKSQNYSSESQNYNSSSSSYKNLSTIEDVLEEKFSKNKYDPLKDPWSMEYLINDIMNPKKVKFSYNTFMNVYNQELHNAEICGVKQNKND